MHVAGPQRAPLQVAGLVERDLTGGDTVFVEGVEVRPFGIVAMRLLRRVRGDPLVGETLGLRDLVGGH